MIDYVHDLTYFLPDWFVFLLGYIALLVALVTIVWARSRL